MPLIALPSARPTQLTLLLLQKSLPGGGMQLPSPLPNPPPRASKAAAIARIHADPYAKLRAPIASVAPDSTETTPGVMATIIFGRVAPQQDVAPACAPPRDGSPVEDSLSVEVGEGLGLLPSSFPPLWNAWWCGGCRSLHFVGDGGELKGACFVCGDINPVRNDIMLDPDEVVELRANPGLSYDNTLRGNAGPTTSFGQKTTTTSFGQKTTGITEDDLLASSPSSFEADDDYERTDLEVSKYPFIERLDHYMERYQISEENRRSVELAIMVEAGSIVREMGTMTEGEKGAGVLSGVYEPDLRYPHRAFCGIWCVSADAAEVQGDEEGRRHESYQFTP